MTAWSCLDPTCTAGGELTHIGINGGADYRHTRDTGHGTVASYSGRVAAGRKAT